MRRSTILLSCARFIMLSLSGARQISGNNVRMSIFIQKKRRTANAERPTSNRYRNLLDDLEGGPLAVTRHGAIQHRANGMNRLPVATDDAADVALAQLHFKDRHLAGWNFGQHHVVGKFDQLPNDEFEKLFHVDSGGAGGSAASGGGSGVAGAGGAAASVATGAGAGLGAAAFFAAAAAAFFAAASGF